MHASDLPPQSDNIFLKLVSNNFGQNRIKQQTWSNEYWSHHESSTQFWQDLAMYLHRKYPSTFIFQLSLLFEMRLFMEECSFPWQMGSQEVAPVVHTLDKQNFSRDKILNSLRIPGSLHQLWASLDSWKANIKSPQYTFWDNILYKKPHIFISPTTHLEKEIPELVSKPTVPVRRDNFFCAPDNSQS